MAGGRGEVDGGTGQGRRAAVAGGLPRWRGFGIGDSRARRRGRNWQVDAVAGRGRDRSRPWDPRPDRTSADVAEDPAARARHRALAAAGPDRDTAAALEAAAGIALGRGAPIVAAELADHALRATPHGRSRNSPSPRPGSSIPALCRGRRCPARTIALDLVGGAASGRERAESLALLAQLEPLPRTIVLLEEALEEAHAHPELQASLHRQLAVSGRVVYGPDWAEPHAQAALALADRLDDDALRAGACRAGRAPLQLRRRGRPGRRGARLRACARLRGRAAARSGAVGARARARLVGRDRAGS